MRERKRFGERSTISQSKQARKKYFLLYEGSDTEVIYFDTVHDLRDNIRLNSLIELVPIIRSFSEEGWSNPKKIYGKQWNKFVKNNSKKNLKILLKI